MMTDFIYALPNWLFALVVIGVVTGYAVGGLLIVHRRWPSHDRQPLNDVAGPVSALVGVVFAVLTAFIAIAVWQQFDQAESMVQREAGAAADVWRQAEGYPEPLQSFVRDHIKRYVETVIQEEWPLLMAGRIRERKLALRIFADVHSAMLKFEPQTIGQQIVHAEQLKGMNTLLDQRRLRLHAADTGLAGNLWAVILLGSALTIAVVWFFGAHNFRAHMAMTIVLAVSVALMIYLIAAMDYPFRGSVSVQPDAFQEVLDSIKRLTK
jgi:hypothetical protein